MWAWPGSRDHDNCTVQTAAMGQIPRSTERILVLTMKKWLKSVYIYRSYSEIKTGVPLFGALDINYRI